MWIFFIWSVKSKKVKEGEQYMHKGVIRLKMNVFSPILVIVIINLLAGCQQDQLFFEHKNIFSANAAMAGSRINDGIPALFVQYESKGNNVFVECIVTGVTFREKDQSNKQVGKMIVWVDGKKSKEVSTAAFIIKDLASGNHKLKLEVVDLHNKPYGLSKEFMVNIPKN
jgi:magnesium-transporting ATPase (P-type)